MTRIGDANGDLTRNRIECWSVVIVGLANRMRMRKVVLKIDEVW